ncbi:MAG: NAD-binding protein [Candidatus Competibacteraceae bacterium]
MLEHTTLERANVRAASAVVLALSNDSEGVFATAVVRDYAPEVPLIVRANWASNVARLYQAGADFALSLGQMAGEILAYHLLRRAGGGRGVAYSICPAGRRWSAGTVASLKFANGPARRWSRERDQNVFVKFDDDFQVDPNDVLFVHSRTPGSLEQYGREFQGTSTENSRA